MVKNRAVVAPVINIEPIVAQKQSLNRSRCLLHVALFLSISLFVVSLTGFVLVFYGYIELSQPVLNDGVSTPVSAGTADPTAQLETLAPSVQNSSLTGRALERLKRSNRNVVKMPFAVDAIDRITINKLELMVEATCSNTFNNYNYYSFSSMGYPGAYPSESCVWYIKSQFGVNVMLSFDSLHTQKNEDGTCRDSVEIYQNSDGSGSPMVSLCDTPTGAVNPYSNVVTVKLTNNGPITGMGSGFMVDYYTGNEFCTYFVDNNGNQEAHACYNGGTCTDGAEFFSCACPPGFVGYRCEYQTECLAGNLPVDSGTFESPAYPHDYPAGKQCTWTLTASVSTQVIHVNFTGLSLEYDPATGECVDYIELLDGSKSTRICGVLNGPTSGFASLHMDEPMNISPFVSNSATVQVTFSSSAAMNFPGFSAMYMSGENFCASNNPCNDHEDCVNGVNSASCMCKVGYMGADCQQFVDYCTEDYCKNGATATPIFMGCKCTCGYGYTGPTCEIATITTPKPSPTTPKPTCGDSSIPDPCDPEGTTSCTVVDNQPVCKCGYGFTGQYCNEQVPIKCGGFYNEFPQRLASPAWPDHEDYPPNTFCVWEFETTAGNAIFLKFDKMDLQDSTDCTKDSVALFDEMGENMIATFCGTTVPSMIYSGSNTTLRVVFSADRSVQGKGFVARAMDYPNPCASKTCPANSHCHNEGMSGTALCTCDPGYTGANCETPIDHCSNDPCQNGGTCSSSADGYMCICVMGYTGVNCESNIDDCATMPCLNGATCVDELNGYHCECMAEFSGTNCGNAPCDMNLSGMSGSFMSPNFPDYYPDDDSCMYTIHTPVPSDQTWIRFLSFNIEGPHTNCFSHNGEYDPHNCTYECQNDMVVVYDGMMNVVATLCDKVGPRVVKVNGPNATVQFMSDSSVRGKGFRAMFDATSAMCADTECPVHATCHYNPDSKEPYCKCDDGYDGHECWEVDECSYVDCNHGNCVDEVNGFHCQCEQNWEGKFCQSKVDFCAASPCYNDAKCYNGEFTYHCECSYDWAGDDCNTERTLYTFSGMAVGSPFFLLSPLFPNNYGRNEHITWILKAPENGKVVLKSNSFYTEPSFVGCYDYVRIYNGDVSSEMIVKNLTFCGNHNDDPIMLTSETPTLSLTFDSDASVGYPGFNFTFTVECLDGFSGPKCEQRSDEGYNICNYMLPTLEGNGVITSPNFPAPYGQMHFCGVAIEVPMDHRIYVEFTAFDLAYSDAEAGLPCGEEADMLLFLDGLNNLDYAAFIQGYCGSKPPSPISSYSHKMMVYFQSSINITQHTGFSMKFSSIPADPCDGVNCGGGHCMAMEDGTHMCQCIPGFCGDNCEDYEDPRQLEMGAVSHIELWSKGTVVSPNYPGPYPDDQLSNFQLNTVHPFKFNIKFEQFDIEFEDHCNYDHLMVYDGTIDNDNLVGMFCGSDLPPDFRSTGATVSFVFYSDSTLNSLGFKLSYTAEQDYCMMENITCVGHSHCQNQPAGPMCMCEDGWTGDHCEQDIDECMSNPCQNNAGCENTQGSFICHCAEGYSGELCSIDMFCPPGFCQHGGECIHGDTEGYCECPEGIGGSHCQIVRCGGVLAGDSGVINSPMYPNNYPNGFNCIWQVVLDPSKRVGIHVDSFDLEPEVLGNCADFLVGYDVLADGMHQFVWMSCGNNTGDPMIPDNYVASTNSMWIQMHSNTDRVTDSGFSLRYVAIDDHCAVNSTCNGHQMCINEWSSFKCECLSGYTGADCMDLVDNCKADSCDHGTCVNEFNSFKCACDAGWTGYFCTEEINLCDAGPCKHGGQCVPKFNGYTCKCSGVFSGPTCDECGPFTITNMHGSIQSPNYPNNYPADATCMWNLMFTEKRSLVLDLGMFIEFDAFSLEGPTHNCMYDYLEIKNCTGTECTDMKLCGYQLDDEKPDNMFLAASDRLEVTFHADKDVEMKGFKMNYAKEDDYCVSFPCENGGECRLKAGYRHCECPEGFDGFSCERKEEGMCGGIFTASSGLIALPEYPKHYTSDQSCTWVVEAPEGEIITMEFLDFDLETYLANCKEADYVEIVDPSNPDESLGLFCGDSRPPVITASTNRLVVYFHSDGSINENGFMAAYYTRMNTCLNYTMCGDHSHCIVGRNGDPLCICDEGYTGDGSTCTAIDYCADVTCEHNATCHNMDGKFSCDCSFGYIGDFCEIDLLCIYAGCDNGGNCSRVGTNTKCTCPAPFAGPYCDTVECGGAFELTSANPTMEVHSVMDYYSPMYYKHGVDCVWTFYSNDPSMCIHAQFDHMNILKSQDCRRDSLQFSDAKEPSVDAGRICPTKVFQGFDRPSTGSALTVKFSSMEYGVTANTGFMFTAKIDENNCLSNPCSTNQLCLDLIPTPSDSETYRCYCAHGFAPPDCTEQIDYCGQQVANCASGSTCMNIPGGFNCTCPAGMMGDDCSEFRHDFCEMNPCQNGGKCINLGYNYTCSCPHGQGFDVFGFNCEEARCYPQVLTASSGIIESPLYPMNYPSNLDCSWTISAPFNNLISLAFDSFEVEGPNNTCIYDRLEFYEYDVIDNGTEAFKSLCGAMDSNSRMIVNDYNATLRFFSDDSIEMSGFRIHYNIEAPSVCNSDPCMNDGNCMPNSRSATGYTCKCVDGFLGDHCEAAVPNECDATFDGAHGSFSTPGFPKQYQSGTYCSYVITLPEGQGIELNFLDFDVDCNDKVVVHAGTGPTNYTQVAQLCGTDVPASVTSPLNYVWIEFVSKKEKSKAVHSGFALEYHSDECFGVVCKNDYEECINSPMGPMCRCREGLGGQDCPSQCGRVDIDGEVGFLSSPRYPDYYVNNADCSWVIEVPYGKLAQLTIDFAEIDGDFPSCNTDTLSVYHSNTDLESVKMADLCGDWTKEPVVLTSPNNYLRVDFKTDGSGVAHGFGARFNTVPKSCDHYSCFNNGTCMETSDSQPYCQCKPGFSGLYCLDDDWCPLDRCMNGGTCSRTPPEGDCKCQAPYVGPRCEHVHCGGMFYIDDQVHSPNWGPPDNLYPDNSDCWYLIEGSREHTVAVSIPIMGLEVDQGDKCDNDYIAFYDEWEMETANLIGKYCHPTSMPAMIGHRNSSRLLMVFHSDDMFADIGFTGVVLPEMKCDEAQCQNGGKCVEHENMIECECPLGYEGPFCNEEVYSFDADVTEDGSFASYNFATGIHEAVDVRYKLTCPKDKKMHLNFTTLDVNFGSSVTVYDVMDFTHEEFMITTLQTGSPLEVLTSGQSVMITMHLNPGDGQGFMLEYNLYSTVKFLNGTSGSLSSKEPYSGVFREHQALYLILIDNVTNIKLQFDYLNIVDTLPDCNINYNQLLLFNTSNFDNSSLGPIGRYCGVLVNHAIDVPSNVIAILYNLEDYRGYQQFSLKWSSYTDYCAKMTCSGEAQECVNKADVGVCQCKMGMEGVNCTLPLDKCMGVEVVGDTDIVHSPRWPDSYVNNADCSYYYEVTETGHAAAVTLQVNGIQGDFDGDCMNDYVEVLSSDNSTVLGKFCGEDEGLSIVSGNTAQSLMLRFVSDGSVVSRGFSAQFLSVPFTTPCDYIVCQNDGVCQFDIGIPGFRCMCSAGYDGNNCEYDTWCPPDRCANWGSCSRNSTNSCCECPMGLNPATNCTSLVHENNNIEGPADIMSIMYPMEYPMGITQTFNISIGGPITLKFMKFDLESADDTMTCSDAVELYSDASMSSVLMSLCGDCIPPVFGFQDSLFLKFQTDKDMLVGSGFMAEIESKEASCDDVTCLNGGSCMTSSNTGYTEFSCQCSPNFSGSYCEKANLCEMDPCKNEGVCVQDISGYRCACKSGFSGDNCETVDCGGTITNLQSFLVSSPQYPLDYPNDANCVWKVKQPEGTTLSAQVLAMDINCCAPFEMNCLDDYLTATNILDGGRQLLTMCGKVPPMQPGMVDTNEMTIEFHSNSWGTNTGFQVMVKADYSKVPNVCDFYCHNGGKCKQIVGDTFICMCGMGFSGAQCENDLYCDPNPCINGGECHNSGDDYECTCPMGYTGKNCAQVMCGGSNENGTILSDTIKSPFYPNKYPALSECMWTVETTAPGAVVMFQFSDFDLEESRDCFSDYVEVKMCKNPPFDCMDCRNSTALGLSFVTGHKYCGNELKNAQIKCETTMNPDSTVVLEFHSDSTINNKGFTVNWDIAGAKCSPGYCSNEGTCDDTTGVVSCTCGPGYGGARCEMDTFCYPGVCLHSGTCHRNTTNWSCECLYGVSGDHCEDVACGGNMTATKEPALIRSSGFPTCSVHDKECTYMLTGPEGSQIFLNITRVMGSNKCIDGEVMMYDSDGSSLGSVCEAPFYIHSTRNTLKLVYKTTMADFGFDAHFNEVRFDPCISNPCLNGGTCDTDPDNLYSWFCNCPDAPPRPCTGQTCEKCIDFHVCDINMCASGSTCVPKNEVDYSCTCPPLYTGQYCYEQITTVPPATTIQV